MAQFSNTVITQKGQALMAKMMAGTGNIQFTKIRTSSQTYTAAQLAALTSLANVRQETLISGVTRTNNTAIKITGAVNNLTLATGYSCNTVGVYAIDPNEGEILYGVTIAENADFIPAYNGLTQTGIEFAIVMSVGNSANVTLQVDPAAVATASDVNAVYTVIADIQAFIGYTDNDIFGIEADFQNRKFTRLAGAESRTPGAMFDGINCFGGRRRCIVNDSGVIIAYRGETGYTETGALTVAVTVGTTTYPVGTFVQVMVYQPKFYYRVVPLTLNKIPETIGYHMRKARYYVSDTPKAGFKTHPAFIKNGVEKPYVLIGAFEGCLFDPATGLYNLTDAQAANEAALLTNKLSSIINAKPLSGLTHNLTRRNCGRVAENRGAGWSQEYAAITAATQLLMVIEYGKFNLQDNDAIGRGVVDIPDDPNTANNSIITGGTSNLGNASGAAAGTNGRVSVSYRGQENPWGNIWKFIDGINVWGDGKLRGGIPFIADNGFIESKNTDNYKSAGFTFPNANGYISAMGYGDPKFDWFFAASEATGTSSVPVGDYHYVTTDLNAYRIARLGGRWNIGAYAGGFDWSVTASVSHRDRTIGGRLVYVP